MNEDLIQPELDNTFADVVRKIRDYRESHGLVVTNPSQNNYGN